MTNIQMSFTPLLSIITVCLNAPNLERTCESIVNQTFQNFEWIVIDGGSNDDTLRVFEKYKYRMNYFVSEPDGGIYYGMNKGIAQANGQWLNFMNGGDCFSNKDVLQKISSDIATYSSFDILYGNVYCTYKDKEILRTYPDYIDLDKLYFYYYFLPHLAMFFQCKLFKLYGNYDTNFNILADTKKNIELFMFGTKFKHLHEVVAIFDDNRRNNIISHEIQENELNSIREIYFNDTEKLLAQKKYAHHNYMENIFTTLRTKARKKSNHTC